MKGYRVEGWKNGLSELVSECWGSGTLAPEVSGLGVPMILLPFLWGVSTGHTGKRDDD